jgi:hypothetical protein
LLQRVDRVLGERDAAQLLAVGHPQP